MRSRNLFFVLFSLLLAGHVWHQKSTHASAVQAPYQLHAWIIRVEPRMQNFSLAKLEKQSGSFPLVDIQKEPISDFSSITPILEKHNPDYQFITVQEFHVLLKPETLVSLPSKIDILKFRLDEEQRSSLIQKAIDSCDSESCRRVMTSALQNKHCLYSKIKTSDRIVDESGDVYITGSLNSEGYSYLHLNCVMINNPSVQSDAIYVYKNKSPLLIPKSTEVIGYAISRSPQPLPVKL